MSCLKGVQRLYIIQMIIGKNDQHQMSHLKRPASFSTGLLKNFSDSQGQTRTSQSIQNRSRPRNCWLCEFWDCLKFYIQSLKFRLDNQPHLIDFKPGQQNAIDLFWNSWRYEFYHFHHTIYIVCWMYHEINDILALQKNKGAEQ